MNLKTTLPKGVSADLVTFSLPFDITPKAKRVNGILTATREKLEVYIDNKLIKSYSISNFMEAEVQQLCGCSMLRCKEKDGKWICIVAFTQKDFLRYAELSKILDFYLSTGIFTEETSADEPSCPKCGISLNGETICPFCSNKASVFFKLAKRLLQHKKLFLISLLTVITVYALDVISPILQRIMIDDLIVPMNKDWATFAAVAASIISIALVDFVLFIIMMRANAKMATAYGRDLRRDIFNKTQELSMNSVTKRTAGELINRVSSDAQVLQDFMTREGRDMVLQSIALVALAVIMFITNWKLACLVVLPLPLVFFLNTKMYDVISLRYGKVWRNECNASDVLHDILHGIRVVKSYGSEEREVEVYKAASSKWAKSARRADQLWYLVIPPIRFLISIGEFLVLYFGGTMVLGQELQLGELVQFTTYVYMLYGPIQWLVNLPRVLARASVSASKVFEVLDEQPDVKDRRDAKEVLIKGDISFDKVFFGYKAYNPVLKNISCEIKAGEMLGIVGHSGVGKSTFINLVMRLYDPTSGSIKIDGVDLRDIEQASLRSQVGVVLQETFLFNGTILENIAYAKNNATFDEVVEAAKIANCHDFIVRLPDGYNTYVGERGYSISGGERQRVAIARAILHNPKIIILDEATASLDTQTEKQIQEALTRLTKGRTTIAIAHRLSTLSNADRLLVLDKGKVAEIGTHNELMNNPDGVYYGLVMAQRQTARIKKAAV